ncbi:pentatricopeptide repeat-containing protein chloroplastic q9ls25 [Diplodia corticola]|uniref:Pentatricopeptide repeat-containing protein chloroplastic q9ls25 n=1 Tax=Diplodia corticola TaxID=236234 RepID=A0A1J9RAD3_9PEZI|nr:pentatricopeptide repeat-containing protein chloroplastic q9ls25 [Diplodia corticola]OJD37130.1 pentatricopeptide repeat-containing protein chloroplastic q9ls25 [Diplodia corticola]
MLEKALLTHNGTLHVAKLIHSYFRRLPKKSKSQALPALLEFADRVIEDIRSGAVPPHTVASLHLLSFLKEAGRFERGAEFWDWLKRKGNDFVDAAVYGAAIELLAAQGKVGLAELEAMYVEALRRFPGNFAEYHLSPEAIVPDRGQPVTIKGLPTSLLQGISFARITWGDWRNAYLGFDTALRLFPTQVPERFFEIFIHERPLAESYTVFMMACRSGVVLRPEHLTVVLSKLVDSQFRASLKDKILAVKGMLNAIHAYAGVGGSIGGHYLSTLVKGFEGLLPGVFPQENVASQTGSQLVGNTARETVLTMSQAGVPFTLSTASSLAGLAGKARLPELLGQTIQDISASGLEPNEVTHRSLVLAAGQIKHLELLELSWKRLVESAETSGRQLDLRDWQALGRASINAGHINFLREQTLSLSHAITDEIKHLIEHEVAKEQPTATRGQGFTEADYALVAAAIAEIKSQVESISALITSGKFLNFYEHDLPTSLVARPAIGSNMALHTVYDELTTDPRLPTTDQPPQPVTKTASGYPLDALRYANWVSINELLLDAEAREQERERRTNKALKTQGSSRLEATARNFPRSRLSPHRTLRDQDKTLVEDDTARHDAGHGGAGADELGPVRQKIRRLRALQDHPHFAIDP